MAKTCAACGKYPAEWLYLGRYDLCSRCHNDGWRLRRNTRTINILRVNDAGQHIEIQPGAMELPVIEWIRLSGSVENTGAQVKGQP